MNGIYYVARLTHNKKDWKTASGPEHKSGDVANENPAFEALYDFGFEEWLFDERHQVDSYQFGYIQNLSDGHQINPILLHTLKFNQDRSGPAKRLLVGLIRAWEYVDNSESENTTERIPECEQVMREDLNVLHGMFNLPASFNQLHIHALHGDPHRPLFNIRFRPSDLSYCYRENISTKKLTENNHFTIESKVWDEIPVRIQRFISENSNR